MKPSGSRTRSTPISLARLTLVTGALVGLLHPLAVLEARADERRCAALEKRDLSSLPDAPTRITATRWADATGELPGYCEVDAYVAPQVGIRVRVPGEAWNGRFHFEGCWALCGELRIGRASDRLARGYAVAATDMGHRGTARSGEWAYNSLEVELEMAYRGTHKAVVAAKAIVEAYAGRPPSHSYWRGCSTGGRQGLLLAQRYPWHFDGILAGAPAYLTPDPINLFWRTATNLDAAGRVILGNDQLPLLHRAAIGQCDGLDGLEDGVIDDPWKCRVDLDALRCAEDSALDECLTPEQIAVAERIYRGAVDVEGESLSPGAQPGSELSWAMYIREPHGQPGSFEPLSVAALRYIFFDFDPGPGYDPREFDYARDIERMFTRGFLYVPNNPDLTAFRKRGGKLLIYQGLNDLLDTEPLIDYYQKATRVAGGEEQVKDFFRLFLVPGMNHCRGGSGVDDVDWMAAMETWVEAETAPDVLIGAKLEAARPASAADEPGRDERRVVTTRPLYPYPHIARYKGEGDPDAAASFEPVALSR